MSEITLHIGVPDSYHTINIECLQHNGTTKTFDMEIHVLPQYRPRIFEIKIDGEIVYSSEERDVYILTEEARAALDYMNEYQAGS
jgi:hypothetical protein